LSGALYGLAYQSFPNLSTGVLAWIAFVPVLLATKETTSFRKYFFQTFLVFIISSPIGFWWTSYFSWKAFFVCYLTQIISIFLPFLLHFILQKRLTWEKALYLLPFQWTLIDWLTHHLPHSLQVYYIAYTQANNIWLIQFADITGMWGIGFWVIMANVILTLFISHRKKHYAIYLIIWLAAPFIYALWVVKIQPKSILGNLNTKSKVSIIQTNVDAYAKYDSAGVQKIFDQIVGLSDSAVRTVQPDLIVLPETAIPFPLFQDKKLLSFTKDAIATWQTSVAIGYVEYPDSTRPQAFKNNALVFTPELAMLWDSLQIKPEDVKVYQKEYGLPFMEFMPYAPNHPSLLGSSLIKGSMPYTFAYGNTKNDKFKVALTICWEQMYPHKMAELVNSGAEFIALMNNDAWFGKTPGAKQLMSFTRIRAIENRRSIVRCSNGGFSCFIDPFGRVSGQLPWFTATIGAQEVLCVQKKSFYTKHPHWFPITIGIVCLCLTSLFFWQRKRSF